MFEKDRELDSVEVWARISERWSVRLAKLIADSRVTGEAVSPAKIAMCREKLAVAARWINHHVSRYELLTDAPDEMSHIEADHIRREDTQNVIHLAQRIRDMVRRP